MTAEEEAAPGPQWSSDLAFIFATAGVAIGLGNLWRFPFLAGENGGGAFVLVYIGAVFAIGLPIMLAEFVIGRHGGVSPPHAVGQLIDKERAGRFWAVIGWLSVLIPFVGIGYYSVVAGWVIDYAVTYIASGGFNNEALAPEARFSSLLAAPWRLLASHAAFLAGVVCVVALGIHNGIERITRYMMPALFGLIIALAVVAAVIGDFSTAVQFLFTPNFSELTGEAWLLAIGQAFFSLAIGIGALMTYGSYLPRRYSLGRAAAGVCIADTAVAILAGLAIFPIVFAGGLDAGEGPGLIFVTLPAAFAQLEGGYLVGSAFFVLLFFAAFTTGIGTLEPVVAWLARRGLARPYAAVAAGLGAWIVGAAAALSFNVWKDFYPLGFVPGYTEKNIFDILDFTIASVLLPVNGLLIALFAGWAISRASSREEIGGTAPVFLLWRLFIRYLAPIAILAVMINIFVG